MKDKRFLISSQGLSVVKVTGKLIVSITFLDQENLSRYKSQVYEEEDLWRNIQKMSDPRMDSEIWQAMYKKVYADPVKTKKLLFNFFRRKRLQNDEEFAEMVDDLDKKWDDLTDFFQRMSERVDEIKEERKPKSFFDVGIELTRRMKKR